jgi:predicted nucleic acid-binding protein
VQLLFADTSYFQALLNRRDSLHAAALELAHATRGTPLVSTYLVLGELLDAFAGGGEQARTSAVASVRITLRNRLIRVFSLDENLFGLSLNLYESRLDKAWGFTDCVSFTVMQQLGILEALTYDQHFVQAGFRALLREA